MIKLSLIVYIALCLITTEEQLTIAIIGSNDIHGKAFPTMYSKQSSGEKYSYGGLVYMATLIDIIKEENKGNTIYLDAGDQFQGGI